MYTKSAPLLTSADYASSQEHETGGNKPYSPGCWFSVVCSVVAIAIIAYAVIAGNQENHTDVKPKP